ncbi:MAG: DHH family phosphoesterase [Planctomycetota bacterium]
MARPRLPSSRRKVNRLIELLAGHHRALIVTHDYPDPDAMASALCLSHLMGSRLDIRCRIVYGGMVGRAENRNMVRALDIALWSVESITFRPEDAVIAVDTQPGFANNSLPPDCRVLAVIDHHEGGPHGRVPLVDVRPHYGAVATILTEYLVSAQVEISTALATAICYAISTETQDLGREATRADIAAFLAAFPLSNQPLLGRLRNPRRSLPFLAGLGQAIRAARVLDGVVVCHLPSVAMPEAVAETADVLAATEGVDWLMCTGVFEKQLVISVRTNQRGGRAGELLRDVVGDRTRAGGHGMIAGGSLELQEGEDAAEVQRSLTRRFLEALGRDGRAELASLMEVSGVLEDE